MIALSFLLAHSIWLNQAPTPSATAPEVTLSRISRPHEKLAYSVRSHLGMEVRKAGLDTWLPRSMDLDYGFTTQVIEVRPEGVAVMKYLRPTMTQTIGESIDVEPKQTVEKPNIKIILTVSPANHIVGEKDLNVVRRADRGGPDGKSSSWDWLNRAPTTPETILQQDIQNVMGQFVNEIQLLALNAGSLDSSLDFAPKLPLDTVKAGDTWQFTVGYSPQVLRGSKEKSAIQRLDYTYTYVGVVDTGDRKVYRVTADLALSSDLAPFIHQAAGVGPEVTGLKSVGLNLKSHIDFDLDLKTCQTLKAVSASTGGFDVRILSQPDQPLEEQKFTGRTTMTLIGRA